MKLIRNFVTAIAATLASSTLLAAELAGYWKHDDQPTWIEIQVEDGAGIGTVRRNDDKPDAVGRVMLKDVVSDGGKPGQWQGQVYAARLEEFKDAEITLPTPAQMQFTVKVGFMSRTVTWTRVDSVPTE